MYGSPDHFGKHESCQTFNFWGSERFVLSLYQCFLLQRTSETSWALCSRSPPLLEIESPKKQHNRTKQSNKTKQNTWRIKLTKRPQAEERKGRTFSTASDWPALSSLLPTTTTTTATTMVLAVFVGLRGDCESRKSSFCLTPWLWQAVSGSGQSEEEEGGEKK